MVTLHRLLYVTQLHFYYTILVVCSPSQYCPAFFWLKARSFTLKLIGSLIKSLRLRRLLDLIVVERVGFEPRLIRPRYGCYHYNTRSCFPQLQYLSTVSLLPYLQETSKQWVLQHHRVNYFWMRFVSQVVIVGLEGLEPPDSEENAFTERPATNYGL